MNIDNISIVSKYFTKYSMDGSLTDFQEEKKSYRGPKTIQRLKKNKTKRTKNNIKGQRDIRIALKQKKNNLISYTEEFDNVCKQVGVDVDSEQLQLAIALSKSLQKETDDSNTSHLVSTQQRIGKIRKTLQEYGFKVPELKIINKKHKKCRTRYKLILTTDVEKSQLILENYSKILFGNLDSSKLEDDWQCQENLEINLFYLTTSALYGSMKDNSIFYVDDLVEKSDSTGSLLRDWSDIPGRPISPELLNMDTISFNEIDCLQDELDIILSGSVKDAQQIINIKQIARDKQNCCTPLSNINLQDEMSPKFTCNTVIGDVPISGIVDTKLGLPHIQVSFKKQQETNISNIKIDTMQYRSSSPDIFDDEDVSSIMDTSKNINVISQQYKTKLFNEDNVIDLTECVDIISKNNNKILLSQNITNRKLNDCMESEYVMRSSQPIIENHNNIDLILNSNEKEMVGKLITNNFDSLGSNKTKPLHNFDLTKSPKEITVLINTDDNIAYAQSVNSEKTKLLISDKSTKHEIDLTQSSDEDESVALKTIKELSKRNILYGVDLTNFSDTSDDLPFVKLSTTQKSLDDDTIILDKSEYLDNNKVRCSMILKNHVDLAQNVKIYDIECKDCVIEENFNLSEQRCFEEFMVDHLKESAKKKEAHEDLNSLNIKDKINNTDIDLTQGSDSSEDSIASTPLKFSNFPNSISLGKEDNMSIVYDEISDENLDTKSSNNSKMLSSKHTIDSNNDMMSNSSQNSEFDISDKELNYSLHNTRNMVNYFNFGGISIMDNITNISLNTHNSIKYKNSSDDFLPEGVKKNGHSETNYFTSKNDPCSSCEDSVATPNNELYIVKTSEVTPILDYESMTTPQRNRELDKYGLKPFKRKRAIQLLTHLYNQTHPIVEPCKDEQPSPSKKRKKETSEWSTPKKNSLSPHKNLYVTPEKIFTLAHDNENVLPKSVITSPKSLLIEGSNENACLYEVTSEVPDIRNIECSPDEWVFQKRETSKVYSCRVPLQVAFHNYVSSRRDLRETILRYEPVNIDVIHKDLVGYGHRYDPKDLLKFLDKKCITVKTTDNNSRNKRQ